MVLLDIVDLDYMEDWEDILMEAQFMDNMEELVMVDMEDMD